MSQALDLSIKSSPFHKTIPYILHHVESDNEFGNPYLSFKAFENGSMTGLSVTTLCKTCVKPTYVGVIIATAWSLFSFTGSGFPFWSTRTFKFPCFTDLLFIFDSKVCIAFL